MVKKTILIGDVEETFKGSAATPLRYKRAFGEDMIPMLQTMSESNPDLLIAQKLAFAMTEDCKNGVDFDEWLDKFVFMDFMEAMGEIVELIMTNSKTFSQSQKKAKATEK